MRAVMNEELRKLLGISIAYGGDGDAAAESDEDSAEADIADAEADPTDELADLFDADNAFALAGAVGVPGINSVTGQPNGVSYTNATDVSTIGAQAINDAQNQIGAVQDGLLSGQAFTGIGTDPETGQQYGYSVAVFGNFSVGPDGTVTVGVGGSVTAVTGPVGSPANSSFTGTVSSASPGSSQGSLSFGTGTNGAVGAGLVH